jgi:hypothetical protein
MSSRNRSEDLLDIRLQHTLKNWVSQNEISHKGREQLLAAAAKQQILAPKPKRKSFKFNFGWSYYNGNLRDVAVHSMYGYALDAITFKTSLAMVIR